MLLCHPLACFPEGVIGSYITEGLELSQPGDLPGGPVVKNLPPKAGDAGSIPDQGTKIPHATRTTKPVPQLPNLRPSTGETPQRLSTYSIFIKDGPQACQTFLSD